MADSTSTPVTVGLDIIPAVTASANLLATVFKAADDIFTIVNSPAMIAARKNVQVQAALDRITANAGKALQTGDLSGVEKDLS